MKSAPKKVTKKAKKKARGKKGSVAVIDDAFLVDLEEALGNKENVLFFAAYLKHGRNATRAYKELKPNVSDHSARVLGSKKLANIDISLVLEAYDLGVSTYLDQLKSGLSAMDMQFGIVPDHRTRRTYHETLGKLLGIEKKDGPGVVVPVQINNHIKAQKEKYDL